MNIRRFILISIALIIITTLPVNAGIFKWKKKTKEAKKAKTETAYQKLFKGKKLQTAKGLMTIHFTDDEEVYIELPKKLLKKDMILTSSIENTSDGDWGVSGFVTNNPIHFFFDATDSLILMKEFPHYRYINDVAKNSEKAFMESNLAPIIASFPIKAFTADSTAYVFNATELFKNENNHLEPIDREGASSMGGIISITLDKKSDLSMLTGVKAHKNNISVSRLDTYDKNENFMGLTVPSSGNMTIKNNWIISLLPQKEMMPRLADPRLGLTTVHYTEFAKGDKGTKNIYYAKRWRFNPKKPIIFYIDPMFPTKMQEAIKKGAEKWNEAFKPLGTNNFIQVKPYPKSDFDPTDISNSCIKYESTKNDKVRENIWTDPRSGEILSARIYIPLNILQYLQGQLFFLIGKADKTVRTTDNTNPEVYKALQALVTQKVGFCLGLDENLAGSYAVPTDSLRSSTYTRKYGLSGSIMDNVPYNFMAEEGDKEKGVVLIQTNLGEYDKYAIKWLYSPIPGAQKPEDEVPYLNKFIKQAEKNPLCLYVRKYPMLNLDPRVMSYDLGNDPVKSMEAAKNNASIAIKNILPWMQGQDNNYDFRTNQTANLVYNIIYPAMDLIAYFGGVYINPSTINSKQAYRVIPKEKQKEMLKFLLSFTDNMDWMDNHQAYKDLLFVRSRGGYFKALLVPSIVGAVSRLNLNEELDSKNSYTSIDGYNDILDFILQSIKKGKSPAEESKMLQYSLISYAISNSNIINNKSKGEKRFKEEAITNIGIIPYYKLKETNNFISYYKRYNENRLNNSGFSPLTKITFKSNTNNTHLFYAKLLKLKKVYQQELARSKDKDLQNEYKFILFSIDRILKIK